MLARLERGKRLRMTHLRWRAQRHGIDVRLGSEQRIDIGIIAYSVDARIAARARDEFETVVRHDRWQMLVARDLADADDREPDGRSHVNPAMW